MRGFPLIILFPLISLFGGSFAQSYAPPTLSPLFNITVTIGKTPPPAPISTGGEQLIEPLSAGSISGPALNGNIAPGLAYPSVDAKQTVQFPQLVLYGTTKDNSSISWLADVSGVGPPNAQWARIADRKTGVVTVPAWCVGCSEEAIGKMKQ
ncbi:MAG: hypothetical protein Q9227_003672 [Pyrenula ochraceoflavens]